MAKITVDGIEVEVDDGVNVVEAAKSAGVHVPHFCYHPSLTVVGQCRMCLVEVEGIPKLQAGCSTPVRDGMKISVWNEKVDKARKGQMEFLLINHPLDCPICDKAGECPLQDYSFNYGSVTSRYGEFKRTYPGMDRTPIGPHVVQNMNRCIHCTRCIRFCDEITETSELAFFKRGASTEVGVFPGVPIDNWMSACVTDLCPTGALTTREFRFESRVWNLDNTESICNGCDVGCNLFIGHRAGAIYRYRPRVNEQVNDHWLCDYGRFSHERYEVDRIVVPKIDRDGYLGVSTWDEAFELIAGKLKEVSPDSLAVIASAQMTNEEAFVLKQLFVDRMACSNVDAMVDPIGPIRMKSRTEWLTGTQAGPNLRGLRDVGVGSSHEGALAERLMNEGADGIEVLYVCEADFSRRTLDPKVVENLRKAKFLVVHAWQDHPLANVADVVLPAAIFAEKEGTFTNLQGRVQRIFQAYSPKGQARTDLDILQRLSAWMEGATEAMSPANARSLFEEMRSAVPAFQSMRWSETEQSGTIGGGESAGTAS